MTHIDYRGLRAEVPVGAVSSVTIRRALRIQIPAAPVISIQAPAVNVSSVTVIPKLLIRITRTPGIVISMLPELRPFLSMLWGVLSDNTRRSKLPEAMVHTSQCRVAVGWLLAMLNEVHGPLQRDFAVNEQQADEGDYIITDASPWGFAGIRYCNHQPVAWFATPLTPHDVRRFQARIGDSAHNTTWEALALLVAARIWLPGTRLLARVRSDSLSALRAMVKMVSRSPALNAIARELALDSVLGLYRVGLATHVPGIANLTADDLSRMWAPDAHAFPDALRGVHRDQAPPRDSSFWKATLPTERVGRKKRRLASRGPQ